MGMKWIKKSGKSAPANKTQDDKNPIRKLLKKISFKIKLYRMDKERLFLRTNCFEPHPPSFYYTHTKEEAQRIIQEEKKRLYELLDSYGTQADDHTSD